MKKTILFCLFIFSFFAAFKSGSESFFVIPENWPTPAYDFSNNPLTAEKIQLGRALFYETKLSRNNQISCSSCHLQFTAFAHVDHALSHGVDNRIGNRNAPALMNLAWQKTFMWDGAINHLDVQALAPISNPKEMDESIANVVYKLQQTTIYPQLYFKAFGDSIITGEYTLKAIAQFMLTLISAEAKYDSVMRKEAVFNDQEKNGYILFQKNCKSCHEEPLFTNNTFQNNGLTLDTTLMDFGRMAVTKKVEDSLKFKVPSLRNLEFSYPYMHDGRFKKLSDVLNHYTSAISSSKTLSVQLQKPIVLTANEQVDLIAFLLTLTDKKFLFNPKFAYPKEILFPTNRK